MSNLQIQHSLKDRQELIKVLQDSLYIGANPVSIEMALVYCEKAKLDIMQKPIHIVPMWDSKTGAMRDVIMSGIGLYRTAASRTGEFMGMTEPEFSEDITETIDGQKITYPKWCKVTVKRKLRTGDVAEFTAKEFWIENYAVRGGKDKSKAPNAMWLKRPYGQIAKCAEAQALRKAFPEIGSAPTAEEMEGKYFHEKDIGMEVVPQAPDFYDQLKFDTNFTAWKKIIEQGKKTADQVIATVENKAPLTEAQKAAIRSIVIPADAVQATPVVASKQDIQISYADVMDKLQSANDVDALDAAADWIKSVDGEELQKELAAKYEALRAKLV